MLGNVAIDARKHASIVLRTLTSIITMESARPNRRSRFARESGFGERSMRRERVNCENFFIAKACDSESVQTSF